MSVKYSPESWNYLRLEFTDEYIEKKRKKKISNSQKTVNTSQSPKISKSPESPKISRQKNLTKSTQSLSKQIPKKKIETKNNVKCIIL